MKYPHAYKLGYMDVDGLSLYVLELPRAGARRLTATRLPAFERGDEVAVDLRRVPIRIRRAARAHLFPQP